MKRGLVVLSIIFLANCAWVVKNSKDDTSQWWLLSVDHEFSIILPQGWSLVTSGPYLIISSGQLIHGLGLPPPPGMWIDIAEGICNKESDDYVDSGSLSGQEGGSSFLEKTICQDNFQIRMGFWSDDPDIEEHKKILEKIVSTFRVN